MITPSHTEPITIPVDISSLGNNTIVPYFIPTNGTETFSTYITVLQLFPEGDTSITIKAVNYLTGDERILKEDGVRAAGQPFVIDNTSPDTVYLFRLNKDEELVAELSAAVAVKGMVNVSYRIG